MTETRNTGLTAYAICLGFNLVDMRPVDHGQVAFVFDSLPPEIEKAYHNRGKVPARTFLFVYRGLLRRVNEVRRS